MTAKVEQLKDISTHTDGWVCIVELVFQKGNYTNKMDDIPHLNWVDVSSLWDDRPKRGLSSKRIIKGDVTFLIDRVQNCQQTRHNSFEQKIGLVFFSILDVEQFRFFFALFTLSNETRNILTDNQNLWPGKCLLLLSLHERG